MIKVDTDFQVTY